MENVYNYLKASHHTNQLHETLKDVKANVRQAWQALVDDTDRMASIMHRKWVGVPQTED